MLTSDMKSQYQGLGAPGMDLAMTQDSCSAKKSADLRTVDVALFQCTIMDLEHMLSELDHSSGFNHHLGSTSRLEKPEDWVLVSPSTQLGTTVAQ